MMDSQYWEDEDGRWHDSKNGNQFVSKDVIDTNEELKTQQIQYYNNERARLQQELTEAKIQSFQDKFEKVQNVKQLVALEKDVEAAASVSTDSRLTELLKQISREKRNFM